MSEVNNGERALTLFSEVAELNIAELDSKARDKLGANIIPMLPPQANIKIPTNALLYAAYVMARGIHPFHGPYAWEQGGQLYIQEHYSVIVKWARQQDDFLDWCEEVDPEMHGFTKADIVSVCHILSKGDLAMIGQLVESNAFDSAEDARNALATSKPGVVTEVERFKTFVWDPGPRRMKPLPKEEWKAADPPHGWTWRMVAEKRAMLNAIRWKYGWPSPSELRDLQGDPLTIASDWKYVTPEMTYDDVVTTVAVEATARKAKEKVGSMTPEERKEYVKENVKVLRGDPDFDLTRPEEPPAEAEAEVDETLDSILDELAPILGALSDEDLISNGKDRFKVQQAYEKLGLGLPNWKTLTALGISTAIAEKRPALVSKEETAEPEEEPETQEEEKEAEEKSEE